MHRRFRGSRCRRSRTPSSATSNPYCPQAAADRCTTPRRRGCTLCPRRFSRLPRAPAQTRPMRWHAALADQAASARRAVRGAAPEVGGLRQVVRRHEDAAVTRRSSGMPSAHHGCRRRRRFGECCHTTRGVFSRAHDARLTRDEGLTHARSGTSCSARSRRRTTSATGGSSACSPHSLCTGRGRT